MLEAIKIEKNVWLIGSWKLLKFGQEYIVIKSSILEEMIHYILK